MSRCERRSAALFDRAWQRIATATTQTMRFYRLPKIWNNCARAQLCSRIRENTHRNSEDADTVSNPGELKKVVAMTDYENHVKDKDDANERWGHVAELIQLATDAEENLAENDIEGGGGKYW